MSEVCKICHEEIESDRHFYSRHKLSQKEYYLTYFPREDPFDFSAIEFKDKEHYFETFFNSRVNMVMWLKESPLNTAREKVKQIFDIRIKQKKLVWVPTEVELKSVPTLPTMGILNRAFGQNYYYRFMKEEFPELKQRFATSSVSPPSPRKLKIAIDSREQKPLKILGGVPMKLDYGDYTALGDDFKNVFIDRKSQADLISTFVGDRERFERELERAQNFGAYVVVLVECSMRAAGSFDKSYLAKFVKATPKFLFKNIREVIQAHDNVQMIFVENRTEAAKYVTKILQLGEAATQIDLQYLFDNKLF